VQKTRVRVCSTKFLRRLRDVKTLNTLYVRINKTLRVSQIFIMPISENEIIELKEIFKDLINYETEDPCDSINPFTYISPDGDNCLHIAVWRGDLRAIQLLIKAGLNVNKTGDMGETPLHIAVRKCNSSVIEVLLKAGADKNIISEFGKSANEEAVAHGISLGNYK
jgi:ankyrin repeat protein